MAATGNPLVLPALASSGTVVSTYKIYSWVPDSSGAPTATPATLYTDAACTTPASNPATLGASVRKLYKPAGTGVVIEVKSSDGGTTYDTIHYPVSESTDATLIAIAALSFSGTNAFLRATASDTFVAENAANHIAALGVRTGTTTNDSASSGQIGEYLTASAGSGTVSLSNGVNANVTSLSLTAGDWDVEFLVGFAAALTTTVSRLLGSLSTTSATLDQADFERYTNMQFPASYTPTNASELSLRVGTRRVSLAATTTIYGVVYAAFGTSTLTCGGKIRARRIR